MAGQRGGVTKAQPGVNAGPTTGSAGTGPEGPSNAARDPAGLVPVVTEIDRLRRTAHTRGDPNGLILRGK